MGWVFSAHVAHSLDAKQLNYQQKNRARQIEVYPSKNNTLQGF